MEIPEKDYDEFEGRLKELSYATDYIPSSEDLVCVMEDGKLPDCRFLCGWTCIIRSRSMRKRKKC